MKSCYLHVPFCEHICAYCDFTRCGYHHTLAEKWLVSVQEEVKDKLSGTSLATMYIGGGTPTSLHSSQLEFLLSMLDAHVESVLEYTMEANVESLNDEKLAIMKRHGVNRISLGVQTLQDDLLKKICRHHDHEMIEDAIQRIHAHGIHNISADMIYGLPSQTMEQWMCDLGWLCEQEIAHISLYALMIEEHSAFGRAGVEAMDEDLETDMFEYAIAFLQEKGFEHYEISNFARDGRRSMHNQVYWHYDDFIGIGCGASGKSEHARYDNTRNLQTYFEQGPSPRKILLSREDEMFEMLMMSLRMKEGLSLAKFYERFSVDVRDYYTDALDKNIAKGWLVLEQGTLHASYAGMLVLNDVLEDFL